MLDDVGYLLVMPEDQRSKQGRRATEKEWAKREEASPIPEGQTRWTGQNTQREIEYFENRKGGALELGAARGFSDTGIRYGKESARDDDACSLSEILTRHGFPVILKLVSVCGKVGRGWV
jgi:hypothetical protein